MVRLIHEGSFPLAGPMGAGTIASRGRTVVLEIGGPGGIELQLTELRGHPSDLNYFRAFGIEPTQRRILVLKSAAHFRAAFEPIATKVIEVDAPGISSPNLTPSPTSASAARSTRSTPTPNGRPDRSDPRRRRSLVRTGQRPEMEEVAVPTVEPHATALAEREVRGATSGSTPWTAALNDNPLPWLLDPDDPAVRHLTLRLLLDRPPDDPAVREAQTAAMRTDPIAAILAAQDPAGFWVKPGPGYSPKYRGTIWQLIFLDQLGADPADPRVRVACAYVLAHSQAKSGGFGCSGRETELPPPPSSVLHCLNGNLLRALLGFGWLDDPRVRHAIDWQARSITGDDFTSYYRSGTSGPGFQCAINEGLPCAWGAIKALRALVRVPPAHRAPHIQRAIDQGTEFLLSHDPALADYPAGWGNTTPSRLWFKLGFPSGYVADLLQNLETLSELGVAKDPRLQPAIAWLLAKQDAHGRWRNEHAYRSMTWVAFEPPRRPSKWVTLRACHVLKAASS